MILKREKVVLTGVFVYLEKKGRKRANSFLVLSVHEDNLSTQ